MKSINASFSAISRTITEMAKAMRQEHKSEIQEAERQRRTEPPVPSEQQLAAAQETPPETPVSSVSTVPTVSGAPKLAQPCSNRVSVK